MHGVSTYLCLDVFFVFFGINACFVQNDTNKKTGEMLHSGILMKNLVENMKYNYYICGIHSEKLKTI